MTTTPDPRDYRPALAELPEPSRLGDPTYDHHGTHAEYERAGHPASFEDNQNGSYTVRCDCGFQVDLHIDDYSFSDDEDDWCDWSESSAHLRATAIGEWMAQLHDRGMLPLPS